ncbi:MAG: ubiquitin-conjugating enzyme E2 [Pirellulaceae bacterium]
MRESPRLRRLRSDQKALQQLAAESTIFSFEGHGDPPELYVLRFAGRGFRRSDHGEVLPLDSHEVHIRLGAAYPRMMPELAWKSPIFQPNISQSGVVCLGGYGTYWVPSLTLDELCSMLWDMIRYENYDETSPYNRDAANWVKHQTQFRLPVDPRPLRDRKAGYAEAVPDQPVADRRKTKPAKAAAPSRRATPTPAVPPVRTAPPPRPASQPAAAASDPLGSAPLGSDDLIFLDEAPSHRRPPVPPAHARDEGGIMFIE